MSSTDFPGRRSWERRHSTCKNRRGSAVCVLPGQAHERARRRQGRDRIRGRSPGPGGPGIGPEILPGGDRRPRPSTATPSLPATRKSPRTSGSGPSTRSIVEAARERGIPTRRLNEGGLVLLGQGPGSGGSGTAETDRTGALAESIAQDKDLTKTLLKAVGRADPRRPTGRWIPTMPGSPPSRLAYRSS